MDGVPHKAGDPFPNVCRVLVSATPENHFPLVERDAADGEEGGGSGPSLMHAPLVEGDAADGEKSGGPGPGLKLVKWGDQGAEFDEHGRPQPSPAYYGPKAFRGLLTDRDCVDSRPGPHAWTDALAFEDKVLDMAKALQGKPEFDKVGARSKHPLLRMAALCHDYLEAIACGGTADCSATSQTQKFVGMLAGAAKAPVGMGTGKLVVVRLPSGCEPKVFQEAALFAQMQTYGADGPRFAVLRADDDKLNFGEQLEEDYKYKGLGRCQEKFLRRMQSWRGADRVGRLGAPSPQKKKAKKTAGGGAAAAAEVQPPFDPTSFGDLAHLPCLLLIVERGRMGDTLPRNLAAWDLRARYYGKMHRSTFIQDAGRTFGWLGEGIDRVVPQLALGGHALRTFVEDDFASFDMYLTKKKKTKKAGGGGGGSPKSSQLSGNEKIRKVYEELNRLFYMRLRDKPDLARRIHERAHQLIAIEKAATGGAGKRKKMTTKHYKLRTEDMEDNTDWLNELRHDVWGEFKSVDIEKLYSDFVSPILYLEGDHGLVLDAITFVVDDKTNFRVHEIMSSLQEREKECQKTGADAELQKELPHVQRAMEQFEAETLELLHQTHEALPPQLLEKLLRWNGFTHPAGVFNVPAEAERGAELDTRPTPAMVKEGWKPRRRSILAAEGNTKFFTDTNILFVAEPQIGKTGAFIHLIEQMYTLLPARAAETISVTVRWQPRQADGTWKATPGGSPESAAVTLACDPTTTIAQIENQIRGLCKIPLPPKGAAGAKESLMYLLATKGGEVCELLFTADNFPPPLGPQLNHQEILVVIGHDPKFMELNEAWCKRNGSGLHARLQTQEGLREFDKYHSLYAELRKSWRQQHQPIPFEAIVGDLHRRLQHATGPCGLGRDPASLERLRIIDLGCGRDVGLAAYINDQWAERNAATVVSGPPVPQPRLDQITCVDHPPVGSCQLPSDGDGRTPVYVQADMADLPQDKLPPWNDGGGSFHVAVFSLSLMGVNWPEYIAEAYRVVKSGGFIYIAQPCNDLKRAENDGTTYSENFVHRLRELIGQGPDGRVETLPASNERFKLFLIKLPKENSQYNMLFDTSESRPHVEFKAAVKELWLPVRRWDDPSPQSAALKGSVKETLGKVKRRPDKRGRDLTNMNAEETLRWFTEIFGEGKAAKFKSEGDWEGKDLEEFTNDDLKEFGLNMKERKTFFAEREK